MPERVKTFYSLNFSFLIKLNSKTKIHKLPIFRLPPLPAVFGAGSLSFALTQTQGIQLRKAKLL